MAHWTRPVRDQAKSSAARERQGRRLGPKYASSESASNGAACNQPAPVLPRMDFPAASSEWVPHMPSTSTCPRFGAGGAIAPCFDHFPSTASVGCEAYRVWSPGPETQPSAPPVRRSTRVLLSLAAVVLLSAAAPAELRAGSPPLSLDWETLVPCVEAAPSENDWASPRERVVAMRLRVTIHRDAEAPLPTRLAVVVRPSSRRLRVLEVLPHSIYEAESTEPVVETTARETTVNVGVGASAPTFCLPVVPNASLGKSHKTTHSETRRRPAKQTTRFLAGPADQARAVYLQWQPGGTFPIEGTHVVTVRWAAPADWRGEPMSVAWELEEAGRGWNGLGRPAGKEWLGESMLAAYRLDDPAAESAAFALEAAWRRYTEAASARPETGLSESLKGLIRSAGGAASDLASGLTSGAESDREPAVDDLLAAPVRTAAASPGIARLRNDVRLAAAGLKALSAAAAPAAPKPARKEPEVGPAPTGSTAESRPSSRRR